MNEKERSFWAMDHIVRANSLMNAITTQAPIFAPNVQITCYSTSLRELSRLIALRDDFIKRANKDDDTIENLQFSQLRVDLALGQLEKIINFEVLYQSKTILYAVRAMDYVEQLALSNDYRAKLSAKNLPLRYDILSKISGEHHGYQMFIILK